MEWFVLFICIIVMAILIVYMRKQMQIDKLRVKHMLMENEKRQQEMIVQLQQQMQGMFQNFHGVVRQDLSTLNETTTKKLFTMEKQVHDTLLQGYAKTDTSMHQMIEQMIRIQESQQSLKEVSTSIQEIQHVLTDKKTRGIYGETELYTILENAMGNHHMLYAKQYKLSNGAIVDAVIFGKETFSKICVDAKFPLENFQKIQKATSKEEQKKYHIMFIQDMKKHIKDIQEKYIIPYETCDFAYLFLPAEAIFSYVYAQCEELIQYSYECKVYIVSSTTLMAYLTAMKSIYLGVKRNEHVEQMQKELKKLQVEFERFEKRYRAISNDFERSYEDMRLLQITAQKLIQRFKDIEAVELTQEHIENGRF